MLFCDAGACIQEHRNGLVCSPPYGYVQRTLVTNTAVWVSPGLDHGLNHFRSSMQSYEGDQRFMAMRALYINCTLTTHSQK